MSDRPVISFRPALHRSGVCLNAEGDLHAATTYVLRDGKWNGSMCCDNESHASYAVGVA
jgi:hypothetical protein